MMKTPSIIAATLLCLCTGCAKAPEPRTFLESWTAAVGKKDAGSLWNLFDKDSRSRVSAALQKSKARAEADKGFKQLFSALNPSVDLSKAPDEMAAGAIGEQLGGAFDPQIDIKADGSDTVLTWHQESARMQVEGGQWRAAVGAVGFVLPDGSAVTLTFSWPVPQRSEGTEATAGKPLPAAASRDGGQLVSSAYFETKNGMKRALIETPDTAQPALSVIRTEKDSKGGDISKMSAAELDDVLAGDRLVPDALDGFHVRIDRNGLTPGEVNAGYGQIARRIAQLAHLPDAYADQAARLMVYYENVIFAEGGPEARPFDVEFAVDLDGSLTATHWTFSRTTLSNEKDVHPRLAFGALPASP